MIKIDFEKGNGLVPCIVQDNTTGQVLMLAYMNEESLQKTVETKLATYWSRSRNELWVKKQAADGVTFAIANRKWSVTFDE